jgi:hypothetical protein
MAVSGWKGGSAYVSLLHTVQHQQSLHTALLLFKPLCKGLGTTWAVDDTASSNTVDSCQPDRQMLLLAVTSQLHL